MLFLNRCDSHETCFTCDTGFSLFAPNACSKLFFGAIWRVPETKRTNKTIENINRLGGMNRA